MSPAPPPDRRVRVLLDCTAIPAQRGGVGRYIEGLLGGLRKDQIELALAVQSRDHGALSRIAPWATVHAIHPVFRIRLLRLLWEQTGLPRLARRLRVDVVHSPHYTFPRSWAGGRVVTVHDATFFSHEKAHRPIKRWFFRMWTRRSWREAGVVITPSLATSTEVTRYLGAPKAAITVAYLGVDLARFHPPSPEERQALVKDTPQLRTTQWFVFLGTVEPRKNVVALLDGYRTLRDQRGPDTPDLLISGARGWDSAAIARLDALTPSDGVRELGYVPTAHLAALLGDSIAVIYPSAGEGFGLPVLEAMASGAAVITTRLLAIPEVGGEAVHYVHPTADSIFQALRLLLDDERVNESLRSAAVSRASLFTWAATAAQHVTGYELATGRRVQP